VTRDFEWSIEGEPATPPVARRPRRFSRRAWLLTALVLLPLLALAAFMAVAERRHAELVEQIHRVARQEEAAWRSGDDGRFLALQDRANERWLDVQRFRLDRNWNRRLWGNGLWRYSLYSVPELGLFETEKPPVYGDVAWQDGYARLDVTRVFSVPHPSGIVHAVALTVPQIYRAWGSGWVRAWPTAEWWGPAQTYSGRRLAVSYPAREAEHVAPLAARLDAWAVRACADWGCPADMRYTVAFSPEAGTLLLLQWIDFRQGVLSIPVTALFARPSQAADDAVTLGLGRLLVRALGVELAGIDESRTLWALVEDEQVRLGLAADTQSAREADIAMAWRDGQLAPFDEGRWWVSTAASITFQRETYGQRGIRALLRALNASGPLLPRVIRALDVTPEALTEAWLAYGQARWSGTAGARPPEGELALNCNSTIKLHSMGGASNVLSLLPPGMELSSTIWSPDGEWLGITARWGINVEAWVANPRTGEVHNFGRGQFLAWAPDSAHFAVFRLVAGEVYIYHLSGLPGQILPGGPSAVVWSPIGDRLAYVGSDATIWLAAGDGTGAQALLPGLKPVWSPDGRSLAYLVPDDLLRPGPEVAFVDADSDATRTVVTASDLTAMLIRKGFGWHHAWVLALQEAVWSPDGSRLALRMRMAGTREETMGLATVTADGSDRRIWFTAQNLGEVEWSPDGRYLAALSGRRVRVVDLESGAQRSVAGFNFAWSPGGQWLAIDQATGAAIFSADLRALWRLAPGCRTGGWRPILHP
jgi:hypothetical protein